MWWHGIPSTPRRAVPERGPHSRRVFPHVHRPLQAARFARNPLVQEVVSCTALDLRGLRAPDACSGVCGLPWAGLIHQTSALWLPAWCCLGRYKMSCPALREETYSRGIPPFAAPKTISCCGDKGRTLVVHSERTRAPLQASCHLCPCSKCDETIFCLPEK